MFWKFVFVAQLVVPFCFCYFYDDDLDSLLKKSVCAARLLESEPKQCSAITTCENLAKLPEKVHLNSLPEFVFKPKLICRSDELLSFGWEDHNDGVYVVEYHNKTHWLSQEITTCNYTALKNLDRDTHYKIRIWNVNSGGMVFGPFISELYKTVARNESVLPVEKVRLDKFFSRSNALMTEVSWTPSKDRICFYDTLLVQDGNYKQFELKQWADPFRTIVGPLEFQSNYVFAVSAKGTDYDKESEKKYLYFNTTSCLDTLNGSTKMCVPEMPENVSVVEYSNLNFELRIEVSWDAPKYQPSGYVLHLIKHVKNEFHSERLADVAKNCTSAVFNKVTFGPSFDYQITVAAYSDKGSSEAFVYYGNAQAKMLQAKDEISTRYLVLSVPILACLCFVLCVIVRKKLVTENKSNVVDQYRLEIQHVGQESNDTILVDQWEINRDEIKFDQMVGNGAFGIVWKGSIKTKDGSEVAIKMLKETSGKEENEHFLKEINIMKLVGKHKHLVSIIGCCTKGPKPLLVVEYCAKGDLRSYLQSVCNYSVNEETEPNDPLATEFANKIYIVEEMAQKQAIELINFAYQVSLAMEFLSSCHVLHRDLAARNVLVTEDKTMKLSDFGLSRDVYWDNVYYKKNMGKVPIRWMAIESLTHQIYTTQSDVWSFGVLLWEIMTLGGHPYPGIPTHDLLKRLETGYRMEIPPNCSEDTYKIMQKCWRRFPKERPTFQELRRILEAFLEQQSKYCRLN